MKTLIICIFSILLISCGKKRPPPYEVIQTIDPSLQEYVDIFEQRYGINIWYSVIFEDLPDNRAGQCSRGRSTKVSIDIDYFREHGDDYYAMHQLMFHEFGHCSMGLGHDESLTDEGWPKSIMYPYVFGMLWYYKDNIYDYEKGLE